MPIPSPLSLPYEFIRNSRVKLSDFSTLDSTQLDSSKHSTSSIDWPTNVFSLWCQGMSAGGMGMVEVEQGVGWDGISKDGMAPPWDSGGACCVKQFHSRASFANVAQLGQLS